jgi:hypothetical protein
MAQVPSSGSESEILFEPINQIKFGKHASIVVNVGSTVSAEMNESDVMKTRDVWRSYFGEQLSLSGQNVHAINLDR